MNTVHQIIVGYCRELGENRCVATGSVSLIKSEGRNILVDCGDPWNGELLKERLSEKGVTPEQIDYLIVTHGHSDHCGNMSLFRNASILMAEGVASRNDNSEYTCFDVEKSYKLTETVEVLYLDGHTDIDLAVVVRNTDKGTVVIAGDLVEDGNDVETNSWKEVSKYPNRQTVSRQTLFDLANYIIPGHGEGFFVCKNSDKI